MKFLKALILATGIAMLAVPLAQAKPGCSDPGLLGQAGYKAVCMPVVFEAEAPKPSTPFITEHQGGQYEPQVVPSVPIRTEHTGGQYDPQVVPSEPSTPFITEHTGGQYDPQVIQPTVINVTPDSGFNWEDAGIGAAGGMLLLLLAGGAVIAINRNRTRLASF